MSQRIKPSLLPTPSAAFPKINSLFDGAILIANRSAELLSALEPAVLRLFLLFHLVLDLIIVFVVLLWR